MYSDPIKPYYLWWLDGYIPFERSYMEKILQGGFKLLKE